ncbi:MAG: hypothetical protein JST48_03090 [Bacteroidetes bacterium]|nr:hypothetical protein [Bacteroidota bacterium]
MVVILDYGVGNLASINNMLKRIGVEAVVSAQGEVMQQASHIILPGVGHFFIKMKVKKGCGYELVGEIKQKIFSVLTLKAFVELDSNANLYLC